MQELISILRNYTLETTNDNIRLRRPLKQIPIPIIQYKDCGHDQELKDQHVQVNKLREEKRIILKQHEEVKRKLGLSSEHVMVLTGVMEEREIERKNLVAQKVEAVPEFESRVLLRENEILRVRLEKMGQPAVIVDSKALVEKLELLKMENQEMRGTKKCVLL